MARLYADEHFPVQASRHLRKCGHEVTTVRQNNANKRGDGDSDAEVLRIAILEQRIVLTFNHADFKALHDSTPNHFGIVSCAEDRDFKALAKRIDAKLREHQNNLRNLFIRIPRPDPAAARRSRASRKLRGL